jgi:DMSO/TMAO reductase YedYZ molybdopterin-dependent catalytic subunit
MSLPPATGPALVPVETRPFNAETPLEALGESPTPTALFYVRNHFDVPRIDARRYRLRVAGRVAKRLELSLSDVQSLPRRTAAVTLECAGNGRVLMEPTPGGTPWRWGAVSTARFGGTPLAAILAEAGVEPDAAEILCVGADGGEVEPGRRIAFERSLPLNVARRDDVLLAWEMNGEPLTAEHGHPLRLVVPGWYGVASVKWLVEVSALPSPFDGHYQQEKYVHRGEPGVPDGSPVRDMRARAVIARPADGNEIGREPIHVCGTAWSGAARVTTVEVSGDGGRTWSPARLGESDGPFAARAWRFEWTPPGAGEHTLVARASDAAGHVQPLEPVWNAQGYGNNVTQRVRVRVR